MPTPKNFAIIGAGPTGLFAAEQLAAQGHQVDLYDHMPSAGRKFLLAGRGGLNLTHSEPFPAFCARYGAQAAWMAPYLRDFSPADLRAWCEGLGQPVFTGSSGRIFPTCLKAAPLLRAWLRRLGEHGVRLHPGHRWQGWEADGSQLFTTGSGTLRISPDASLLALGGASWPRMGADGGWVGLLRARGVRVAELRPSNGGVAIGWSATLLQRHEGAPLKRIALSIGGQCRRGEAVITRAGLEGGAVYALSPAIRAGLDEAGQAILHLDLRPDIEAATLATWLDGARQGKSLSNFLRQHAQLAPAAIALVQEALHHGADSLPLSCLVKALPLRVHAMAPIARAISSAGGVALGELTPSLMLARQPGLFAAGEMLDWEAPTGGYLLQACFATGAAAARGMVGWAR